MDKFYGYRFRCPVCGLMGHSRALYRSLKFQLYNIRGRGFRKGIEFIPIVPDNEFMLEFREHMLNAVLDLASNGLLDLTWFKKELNRSAPVIYRSPSYSDSFPVVEDLHDDSFPVEEDLHAEAW